MHFHHDLQVIRAPNSVHNRSMLPCPKRKLKCFRVRKASLNALFFMPNSITGGEFVKSTLIGKEEVQTCVTLCLSSVRLAAIGNFDMDVESHVHMDAAAASLLIFSRQVAVLAKYQRVLRIPSQTFV